VRRRATSEDIQEFANRMYLQPARTAGKTRVTIRVGELHDALGLKSQMSAVCGAIGGRKFREDYLLKLVERQGPTHEARALFTFELL
jgi:hypothetical protein